MLDPKFTAESVRVEGMENRKKKWRRAVFVSGRGYGWYLDLSDHGNFSSRHTHCATVHATEAATSGVRCESKKRTSLSGQQSQRGSSEYLAKAKLIHRRSLTVVR